MKVWNVDDLAGPSLHIVLYQHVRARKTIMIKDKNGFKLQYISNV